MSSFEVPQQTRLTPASRSTDHLPGWTEQWDWASGQPRSASALGRLEHSSRVTIPLDDVRSSFSGPYLTTLEDSESPNPQTEEAASELRSPGPSIDVTGPSPSVIPPQVLQTTTTIPPGAAAEPPLVPPVSTTSAAPAPVLPLPVTAVTKPRTFGDWILIILGNILGAILGLILISVPLGGLVALIMWLFCLFPHQKCK